MSMRHLAAVLAVLGCTLMAGCGGHSSSKVDGPSPPVPKNCHYPASGNPPTPTGPVTVPTVHQEFGLVTAHGRWYDDSDIDLHNDGTTPVLLRGVILVPGKHTSKVRFGGAFVAPSDPSRTKLAKNRKGYRPVAGYCLKPTTSTSDPPVLVLRIAAAKPGHTDGFKITRNNDVNLVYRTADGQDRVAVYPIQFEFTNRCWSKPPTSACGR